jgi:CRISPR/Cas system CSM-associated protein Csm3 (group 7 of RAMP superfamily)
MASEAAIIGRIVLEGALELEAPAIIGSGEDNYADMEVVRDCIDFKPYIPGTALAGALRHYFCQILENEIFKDFWGFAEEEKRERDQTIQSSVVISDLLPIGEPQIRIRDSVKIDNRKGTALDRHKFDYEVIEKGAQFALKMDVVIREKYKNKRAGFQQIIASIIHLLGDGKIGIGARNTSGFGKCVLKDCRICEFDYEKKDDIIKWLSNKPSLKEMDGKCSYAWLDRANAISQNLNEFLIDAQFSIKNSLIVRSYSDDPSMPDAVHIKSSGHNVLPGTSLRGALRHRAIRILNTLRPGERNGENEKFIFEIFGNVTANIAGGKATRTKSRLSVEEAVISEAQEELQNRIRIDRFTGGTIKAALFDSMPLWDGGGNSRLGIKMFIKDYKPEEAGLLLLLLKDLWTEDLAVGGEKNVGRGVLKGVEATIKTEAGEIQITRNGEDPKISPSDAKLLNRFVAELKDKLSSGEKGEDKDGK